MGSATWTADGSVGKLLQWRVTEDPGHEFLYVEDDGPWTFRAIAAAAVRLHDGLVAAGVTRGDRVIVRAGNDERFPAAAFAVWMAGGGVIAMHPSAPAQDVSDVAESMTAAAIITDPGDTAVRTAGRPVIDVARFEPCYDTPLTGDAAARADRFVVPADIDGSAVALVLLTSGSTGRPKGVVLTHDNAWANLKATVSAFRSDTSPTALPATPKPPNLIANPLSHTAGVVRLLFALYVGRSVALLRKFDGIVAKRLLDRHGIDNLTINPAMMRILLDQLPVGETLGAVRYASSGTAPLPAALREEFESRFGIPVLQAYGQTEAFGGIAIEKVSDVLAGRRKPGSVGKPLPGVELRIVDAAGREVAPGDTGELLVRTLSSTSGYLGADAQSPVDPEGWLRTGDRGRTDDDGYLYITGRIKNIIICGGFNIVPEEIEAALAQDELVREAAVLGIADARLGEIPVALVESDAEAGALLERAAARLAPYKRPRRLFVVERLPRVPNGKVDRPAATELARSLAAPN
jgi:long-chain acyl-CoA synthetase